MGRLTQEIFNESCCDGGECSLQKASARPCGCDPGANHRCANHSSILIPIDKLQELVHLLQVDYYDQEMIDYLERKLKEMEA